MTGLPTGVTAVAPSVYLCANSPQAAQITVTVPPGTPQGTSQLTIIAFGSNGNAGQASNQYIYPFLQVGSGGSTFSISTSPMQTVPAGGTAQYTVTVNGSAGLSNVTLTASSAPPGATALFNGASSASVPVGGSATMTVAIPSNAALGSYFIPITGMSGTVPKYSSAALKVAAISPASIIAPMPGAMLTGPALFTWNNGIGMSQYSLTVSSPTVGTIYSASLGSAPCTAQNAPPNTPHCIGVTIPAGVSTVNATLISSASAVTLSQSHVYTISSTQGATIPLGKTMVRRDGLRGIG